MFKKREQTYLLSENEEDSVAANFEQQAKKLEAAVSRDQGLVGAEEKAMNGDAAEVVLTFPFRQMINHLLGAKT